MRRRSGAQQQTLTLDPQFSIPPFTGHHGWIEMDVEDHAPRNEIETLMLTSHRHLALKRMLKSLDAET